MPRDFKKFIDFDYVKHKTTVTIMKDDINDFVAALHEVQLDYIDQALEMSDLSEADGVIKHIMSLK
jgi:hypothetical protein